MTSSDDPAFPSEEIAVYYGLTKLELISAMAMHGCLSSWPEESEAVSPEALAVASVDYANALLERLEAETGDDANSD